VRQLEFCLYKFQDAKLPNGAKPLIDQQESKARTKREQSPLRIVAVESLIGSAKTKNREKAKKESKIVTPIARQSTYKKNLDGR